jgi:hypothetical protein
MLSNALRTLNIDCRTCREKTPIEDLKYCPVPIGNLLAIHEYWKLLLSVALRRHDKKIKIFVQTGETNVDNGGGKVDNNLKRL